MHKKFMWKFRITPSYGIFFGDPPGTARDFFLTGAI